MNVRDLEKTTSGDIVHSVFKGALGAIPYLGSAAVEIFGLVFTPPLEKRKIQIMNNFAERLNELESSKKIDLTELSNNEHFIDVLIQSTTFAIRTSQKEKIEAFKNAILNTAVGCSIDETKSHIFINQLDIFTVWHIKLLQFVENPVDCLKNASKPIPNYVSGSLATIIRGLYPELSQELLNIIWNDLKNAGFIDAADTQTMMTGNGLLAKRTTNFGDEFLNYIRFS